MSNNISKLPDSIMVAAALTKIAQRKPSPRMVEFLRRSGESAEALERHTWASAQAKIRLVLADVEPREAHDTVEREIHMPTDKAMAFAIRIGLAPKEVQEMDAAQLSDAIQFKLAEIGAKRDARRTLPLTSNQRRALAAFGLDDDTAGTLTFGQAQDLLRKLISTLPKKPT